MKKIIYRITRMLGISFILFFTLSAQLCNYYYSGESSLLTYGEAYYYPWSGWWWPMLTTKPPHLYDSGGPLDKYNSYVLNTYGFNPGALSGEIANDYTTDPANDWWGHCNGWSAASILEWEPDAGIIKNGIDFSIGDLKGILTEWYNNVEATDQCGHRYPAYEPDLNDPYPHEFHNFLITNIGELQRAIVIERFGGTQELNKDIIWNHPVYKYWMTYNMDPYNENKYHVECRIRFVSCDVSPDDTGTYYFEKYYYYWIYGDKRYPSSGMWETASDGGYSGTTDSVYDHPDFAWYPAQPTYHEYLNYNFVNEITYHYFRKQGENK